MNRFWKKWIGLGVLALGVVGLMVVVQVQALSGVTLQSLERLSVGTDGTEGNNSSFYVYLSENGRAATFESWVNNWDNLINPGVYNWVDIYYRNLDSGETRRLTLGDEDSFDPMITADGRYIVFNSYASNLVPNDTNRGNWTRDGLDVFLYDVYAGTLQRVSLTWGGAQIEGNSFGAISPDGNYIVFASNGINVVQKASPGDKSDVYVRDWRSGTVERITEPGNADEYPDGLFQHLGMSYDGRYVVYGSNSTNLAGGDFNGEMDIFIYDRELQITKLISRGMDGLSGNGLSGQPQISQDGRFVTFRSLASNLVPDDNNGTSDVFLYEMATEQITRVSVSDGGVEGNGISKDPSVCNDGRYVSFTSEANNLVPDDVNHQRDIFLYDVVRAKIKLVKNMDGQLGNGKAHRSFLAPSCDVIAFATEATNFVADDTNGARDIFWAGLAPELDLSGSTLAYTPTIGEPGEQIEYTFRLRNDGVETAVVSFVAPIPDHTTYVTGSAAGGAVYSALQNRIEWTGPIGGGGEAALTFAVTIDPALTDFAVITTTGTASAETESVEMMGVTVVNGRHHYLPMILSQ